MKFSGPRHALPSLIAVVSFFNLCAARPARAQHHDSSSIKAAGDFSPANSNADLPDSPQPRIPAERLTFDHRIHLYVHSFTNVEALLGPPFGAAMGQWTDSPPEWGQGSAGYGRRLGSGYARMFISQSIRFGVAAADGEDPRSEASNESGIWRRTRHAVLGNFVAHSTRGAEMPAISRIAGPYGAAFVSNAWYPASHADTPHALERGTSAFGSSIGWSVFREFWPDIHRKLHFGRSSN